MYATFRHFRFRAFLTVAIFFLALTPLRSQDAAKASSPGGFRAGTLSFSFPSPSSDLVETGADYRVLLEPFAPTSNRLVAAFVVPSEFADVRNGKSQSMSEYALIEIPRRAEFADVTPEIFKQIVDGTGAQFGANLESQVKDSEEDINRRLKALNSSAAAVTVDKPVYLGALFSKPNAYGFGATMAFSSNGTTRTMAMGMVVFRVQNRVFFGYVYKQYQDESTLLWLRKATEQWADSILSANKQ